MGINSKSVLERIDLYIWIWHIVPIVEPKLKQKLTSAQPAVSPLVVNGLCGKVIPKHSLHRWYMSKVHNRKYMFEQEKAKGLRFCFASSLVVLAHTSSIFIVIFGVRYISYSVGHSFHYYGLLLTSL